MQKKVILIPAYNPDAILLDIVKKLSSFGFEVLIINDGSNEISSKIFIDIKLLPNINIIRHFSNQGKGAALKTGFNYILTHYPKDTITITADADGQHSIENILTLIDESKKHPQKFIIGYRKFDSRVPARNRIGNIISQFMYDLITGMKFKDTQSGLRSIPREVLEKSLLFKSNGYEFETEQLLYIAKYRRNIYKEIEIETIYKKDYKSHFNPVLDSMLIYFILFRHTLSSLSGGIVDVLAFTFLFTFTNNIYFSNLTSRLVSTMVQFIFFKNFTYKFKPKPIKIFLFILLVAFVGTVSAIVQKELSTIFDINFILIKIITEITFFFINFLVIKNFIFKRD